MQGSSWLAGSLAPGLLCSRAQAADLQGSPCCKALPTGAPSTCGVQVRLPPAVSTKITHLPSSAPIIPPVRPLQQPWALRRSRRSWLMVQRPPAVLYAGLCLSPSARPPSALCNPFGCCALILICGGPAGVSSHPLRQLMRSCPPHRCFRPLLTASFSASLTCRLPVTFPTRRAPLTSLCCAH